MDARLRQDGVELYNALWGRLTPGCVPPQGVSEFVNFICISTVNHFPRVFVYSFFVVDGYCDRFEGAEDYELVSPPTTGLPGKFLPARLK